MQKAAVIGGLASPIVFLAALCPGLLWLLAVLAVMMLLDYISGMIRAWVTRTLSSRTGLIGICKKVGYLILVAAALGVDYVITSGVLGMETPQMIFAVIVCAWLIINEALSVLENLLEIGVPVPAWLDAALRHLLKAVDRTVERPVENSVDNGDNSPEEKS